MLVWVPGGSSASCCILVGVEAKACLPHRPVAGLLGWLSFATLFALRASRVGQRRLAVPAGLRVGGSWDAQSGPGDGFGTLDASKLDSEALPSQLVRSYNKMYALRVTARSLGTSHLKATQVSKIMFLVDGPKMVSEPIVYTGS